jgi:hypothetical protein
MARIDQLAVADKHPEQLMATGGLKTSRRREVL